MPEQEKLARGKRVEDLRKALDWTHETVAQRSGGLLRREYVSKVESGQNTATSVPIQQGLANAFGLTLDDVVRYLDGKLTRDETLARRGATAARAVSVEKPERYPNRARAAVNAREIGVLERAVEEVLVEDFQLAEDRPVRWWFEEMVDRERRIKRHGDAPPGRTLDDE